MHASTLLLVLYKLRTFLVRVFTLRMSALIWIQAAILYILLHFC
jgi:hypothetical protein